MASTATQTIDAAIPVGNVSSALSRNEATKPTKKKTDNKPKSDPNQKGKPVIRYPPNISQTPEERYKDIFGIVALRSLPRAPRDQHLADLINTMQRYLSETAVERLFINYLEILLARQRLPYNPYPGFLRRFRRHAEGRLVNMKPRHEILSLVDQPYAATRIDYLFKNRDCDFLWGLPSVLSCCDKDSLKQYEWLVKSLVPHPITMRLTNLNFSIQAIVALVGAAVFHGTFVDSVPMIQVRVEYFIVGPSEENAIDIFVNSLISDLYITPKQTQHFVMGITVAANPDAEKGKFWSMDNIAGLESDFSRDVAATIKRKKYITAEMIFRTDPFLDTYKRGQKLYTFNFRKQTNKMTEKEGSVASYSELEEVSLHDGVFFDRGHAEAYITMFTPRLELIDKDKMRDSDRPERTFDKHLIMNRYKVRRPARPSRRESQMAGDFQAEAEAEAEPGKAGQKVRVDGFELQLPRRFAPDATPVVDAIRSAWQRKIAAMHPVADIFKAMPYIVGLVLLDREAYTDETLVQCYKIYRSSAARTWHLMQENRFIRELIEHFEKTEDSKLVQLQFKSYKAEMKELLESELRECSSEMITAGRAIQFRLSEMTKTSAGAETNIYLGPKSVLDMKFINHYCRPVFYQFVEDIKPECPIIFEIIDSIHEDYPSEGPSDQRMITTGNFFFGYEDERLTKQDKQFIDVQICAERESAPASIIVDSIVMKYLLNTHIDETWANFVLELVMNQHLPPNPFPRLISALRQSAMKMAYWIEDNATLVQRLYHGSPRLVDPLNFVFQMPGCDAFGVRSALLALDSASFFSLANFLKLLQNSTFTQKKGNYRVGVTSFIHFVALRMMYSVL